MVLLVLSENEVLSLILFAKLLLPPHSLLRSIVPSLLVQERCDSRNQFVTSSDSTRQIREGILVVPQNLAEQKVDFDITVDL